MMKYEPIALWTLLIVLVIGSFSNVIAARQATQAVQNTDLIKQCTTPGTKCFVLSAQSRKNQNDFFIDLITKANRCLLESAFNQGIPVTGAARIKAYDDCIARIPPVPPPDPTATTTTRR